MRARDGELTTHARAGKVSSMKITCGVNFANDTTGSDIAGNERGNVSSPYCQSRYYGLRRGAQRIPEFDEGPSKNERWIRYLH